MILETLRKIAALNPGEPMPDGWHPNQWGVACSSMAGEAADEIERLTAENERLRAMVSRGVYHALADSKDGADRFVREARMLIDQQSEDTK